MDMVINVDEDYRLIHENAVEIFKEYKDKNDEVKRSFEPIVKYLVDSFPCIQSCYVEVESSFVNIILNNRLDNEEEVNKFWRYLKNKGKEELGYNACYPGFYSGKIQFR